MKTLITALVLLSSTAAKAEVSEVYAINGKNFASKAAAIRYVIALGKPVEVLHTRCEILTNKLTFKACPKNKLSNFDNLQFTGLKQE